MRFAPQPLEAIAIPALAQNALDNTRAWIERFGGRLAGTPACRAAAQTIQAELAGICGRASLELFSTRPDAFTRFYRVDVVLYLVGLLFIFLDQPLPAALILTFMFVAAGLQFGWYRELYDWLYPRKECANVTAVLEPRGEARQQLIFSGHHDSALVLNFLKGNQKLYGLKIIVPDAFRALGMVACWVWLAAQRLGGAQPAFVPLLKVLLLAGVYFVFTKFFLFGPEVSPGAGDNLIASAMLLEVARAFADPETPGRSTLEHTRLLFVSFDAEEAGLRGSRAWVRQHRAEIAALPTYALNIDSIYQVDDLQFMLSDLNSHVRLDADLARDCQRIAAQQGYPAGLGVMRFGGGATDAAELAQAGVRATTLIAMSTSVVREGLVYHSLRDTLEAIQPAAVEASLAVATHLALELDHRSP